MIAQVVAQGEVANSQLRRRLARNRSPSCAEVEVGYSALLYNSVYRKSAPRRRGAAANLDVDEAGVMARFHGQTFRAARFCACPQVAPKDVGAVA